jgi:hypothetical protein
MKHLRWMILVGALVAHVHLPPPSTPTAAPPTEVAPYGGAHAASCPCTSGPGRPAGRQLHAMAGRRHVGVCPGGRIHHG